MIAHRRPNILRSASIAGITAHSRQGRRPTVSLDCPTELSVQGRRHGSVSGLSVRSRKERKPASVKGISVRSRQIRRHHPYLGLARRSIQLSKRTANDKLLSVKEKELENVHQNIESTQAVRSWTVSNMASLFQCNLTLNIDRAQTNITQSCFAECSQRTDETKPVDQEVCDLEMVTSECTQTMHEEEIPYESRPIDLHKKKTDKARNDFIDSVSKSTSFSVPVSTGCMFVQTPNTKDNVVKSKESISPSHPETLAHSAVKTQHQIDCSNHNLSSDPICGNQSARQPEVPEPCHENQWLSNLRKSGTEDDGFFADDEGDDLHVWAPSFDDLTNLWSCLYHTKPTTRSKSTRYAAELINDSADDQCDVPKRLRRQNTIVLQPNIEPDTDTADLVDKEEDVKECIPPAFRKYLSAMNTIYGGQFTSVDDEWFEFAEEDRALEHTKDAHGNQCTTLKNRLSRELMRLPDAVDLKSHDSLAYPMRSEYRELIPTYTDFCCWVCGAPLERQEVMDLSTWDCGEMPPSSSSFTGDVELYCSYCDSTRSVFNVDDLLD